MMSNTPVRATRRRKRTNVPVYLHHGIPIREIRPGYFLVDFRRSGKNLRQCYTDLASARVYCEQIATDYHNYGIAAFDLSLDQRSDAFKALEILKDSATLVVAAQEYVRRHPLTRSESVWRTAVRYLRQMRRDGCRPISIREKRCKFVLFCRDVGRLRTVALDDTDLQAWVDQKKYHGINRHNYLLALRSLLNFYHGRKRAKRHTDERLPVVWQPDVVEKLFRSAQKLAPEFTPALAVLFFSGLRPYEMMRLTWSHIDLGQRFIRLTPDITKTRNARVVDISTNAVAWLAPYRKTDGPLIPSEKAYRTWREKVMTGAGIARWVVDVPRHTFATAHYAQHGDAARTAQQLGHFGNLDMFTRHYKGLMDKHAAAKYWQIKPAKAKGNLIRLAAIA